MKNTECLAAAALLLGVLPMVAAAESPFMPTYTIYGGYSHAFTDDARASDDGRGFFVGLGVPINEYWNVDFSAFHHKYSDGGPSEPNEWAENGGKVDLLFYYSRQLAFSPYVGLGAGYAKSRLEGAGFRDDGSFFDAGLGFQSYPFSRPNLGLMADARYRWLKTDIGGENSLEDVIVRVGLVVPFGSSQPSPAAPAAPATPVTAPPPAKETSPVQELDAERRFADVLFAFDRSELTPTAIRNLDGSASTINELVERYPRLRIKVDGHADWIGTDGYNLGLGERRANAVKQYLVRKGVAPERIDTTSYGESKPVAPNETAEGRQLNRRTEVRTTAQD